MADRKLAQKIRELDAKFAASSGIQRSWRVDETYIKVKGQWVYLYWVVDKEGCTVDFLLSRRRDMAAARRFFSRETKQRGAPRVM